MSQGADANSNDTKLADKIAKDDPHKVEKLAKAGEPDKDPDEASE
jgi:hypothetical protein